MSSVSSIARRPAGLVQDQIGIAVLAKAMDSIEQQGQQLVQLMQQRVQPHLGNQLDIKV